MLGKAKTRKITDEGIEYRLSTSLSQCKSMADVKQRSNGTYCVIALHQGQDLPAMDRNGLSDPYIVIEYTKQNGSVERVKSSMKKKTLSPDWQGERLVLLVDKYYAMSKGVLAIKAFDRDILKKDDYMGCALLNMKKLVDGKNVDCTLELDGASGRVSLSIEAHGFGVSAQIAQSVSSNGSRSSMQLDNSEFLTLCENGAEVVAAKLANSLYGTQLKDAAALRQFAEILSDPERIRETYLNTKWAKTVEAHKSLSDLMQSKEEPEQPQTSSPAEDDDNDETENSNQITSDVQKVASVKLLIVDQDQASATRRNIRRFISPILSRMDVLPKMAGMYHSALMIGPWLLEWNNSGLCVPRKVVSKAALLSLDLEPITTIQNLEDCMNALSRAIAQWNTSKSYSLTGSSSEKDTGGNCQQFVESILHAIGVKLDIDPHSPLGQFLEQLRTHGSSELCFRMDQAFREKFGFTDKSITFESHVQLDQFVATCCTRDVHFLRRPEAKFLKAIDRAFWLRYFRYRETKHRVDAKLHELQLTRSGASFTVSPELKSKLDNNIAELKLQLEALEKEAARVLPLKRTTVDEENEEVVTCVCPFGDPQISQSVVFIS